MYYRDKRKKTTLIEDVLSEERINHVHVVWGTMFTLLNQKVI